MASPGLLSTARLAALISPRAVVTAPAWHLGPDLQVHAQTTGYDQTAEDELLARASWENDGYELFSIATPAASSHRGLFGPMGESSSLFLRREQWDELNKFDPAEWQRELLWQDELLLKIHARLPKELIFQRELLISRL